MATQEAGPSNRSPQSGDALILADGRRFVISGVEAGLRGWWFTAQAQDHGCAIQGNLELAWDESASAWRPEGVAATPPAVPRSMRKPGSSRLKQAD